MPPKANGVGLLAARWVRRDGWARRGEEQEVHGWQRTMKSGHVRQGFKWWNIFIFVIDGKRWEEGEREVYKEEHVSDEGAPFNVSM